MTLIERDDDDILAASAAYAIEELNKTDQAAGDLLMLLGFLGPDDASRRMLLGGASALPVGRSAFAANPESLAAAIHSLKTSGLVDFVDNSVKVHRSWQLAVRENMSGAEQETWCAAAVGMLLTQFPLEFGVRDWNWLERLVPHSTVALKHADALGVARAAAADLRCRISVFYLTQGQYRLASETLTRATNSVAEDKSQSRLYGRLLNYRAVAEREMGLVRTARADAEQALSIHRGSLLATPTRADTTGAIAVSGSTGAAKDARRGADTEVEVDDPDVVRDLHNLGIICRLEGRLADSIELLKEALRIDMRLRGENAWYTADIVEDVSFTCIDAKSFENATDLLRDAVDIREASTGGSGRVETIMAKFLLDLLVDPKDFDVKVREMLEVSRREYGERHPSVSSALRVVASAARHRSQYDEAARLLREADELDVANFGPKSFKLVDGHIDALLLFAEQDMIDPARDRLIQAFAIIRSLPSEEWETVFNIAMRSKALDFALKARPLIDDVLPLLVEAGIDGTEVTYAAQVFVMRAKFIAGGIALQSGAAADARYQFETGLVIAATTEPLHDDAMFEIRLGAVAVLEGDAAAVEARFRQAMQLFADAQQDPIWSLLNQVGQFPANVVNEAAARHVVNKLADEARGDGKLSEFRGSITAAVPDGWFQKESITLLSADGQANVITSSEPLDASITNSQYAEVQGDLLRDEFPEYVEHSFESADIFGGHSGFVRVFSWTPPDGVSVTQVQYYFAEEGRGYTATATTPSSNYGDVALVLEQVLRQLRIDSS